MDVLSFLLLFLVWEAAHILVRYFLRIAVTIPAFKRFCPDEKKRADISVYGVSYLTSTIHATIVAIRGTRHLYRLWSAPMYIKLQAPLKHLATEDTLHYIQEARSVIFTNIILGGYLVSDLIHVISNYPKLGKIDTICHHLVFLICSWMAGMYRLFPFMFGWLIVGEASTPFLNLRWLLIQSGNGSGPAIGTVSAAFAFVFFVTRFWIYGSGLVHQILRYGQNGTIEDVPRWVSDVIMVLVIGGFLLNLLWLEKIRQMAVRGGKVKKRSPSAPVGRRPVEPPVATASFGARSSKKEL